MAQSLIEQLQLDAVDGQASITDLLRRAKLAASKLKSSDFAAWVEVEMNGYGAQTPVPHYRRVRGNVKFFNPYRGWQPVFGLENVERDVRQPVGELFTLSKDEAGFLTIGVSEKLRRRIASQIEFECDVQMHVSRAAVYGVVDAVRNNVLDWAVKLEKAGIHGRGLAFTPEETKAAQNLNVTNNYHAPVALVSQGNSNTIQGVSQTNSSATPQEIADAVGSLLKAIAMGDEVDTDTDAVVADLAQAETDLRAGRVPFGKLSKALQVLDNAEDIALRAPGVVSKIHALWQMLGWN
jgi:hypothetical protein